MQTLAELFHAANDGPIEFEGRCLHATYELAVAQGEKIVLQFLRSTDHPVQGLGLECEKCEIEVAQTVATSFALWTDTAPSDVDLRVIRARAGARVTLFNQWRDEKHGSTMYRLNNAAIEILPQADGSVVLRCSDGWGEPDFSDLVVRVVRGMP